MHEIMTKAALRQSRLAARDGLSPHERESASASLCRHGLEAISIRPGLRVAGYYPIRSEVDIMPLLHDIARRGAIVCLPAVLDRETIVFRHFDPDLPLVDTGWGTKGASASASLVEPDVILMPLSAFDAAGNRIGYGAGHYDRAIGRMRESGKDPYLIGVAFDLQKIDAIPADDHDVPLDAILTESGFALLSGSV